MSQYYLINRTKLGVLVLHPGALIDSAQDDVAGIQAAGGRLVASSDPTIAFAAALATSLGARGQNQDAAFVMMAAATQAKTGTDLLAALALTTAGNGSDLVLDRTSGLTLTAALAAVKATADAGVGVVHRTVTVDFTADGFAALGAGVKTFSKNLSGGALPASARFSGVVVGAGSFIAFDDAAHGTYSFILGSASDDNALVSAVDVAAGQTGFPKPGTLGVLGFSDAPLYAETLVAKLTSSVDLNTVTQGHCAIDAFYFVLV